MVELILQILVAASVGCFAWGVCHLILSHSGGEKRRIHQRLSSEGRPDSESGHSLSITRSSAESGLPTFLARKPLVQVMQQRLSTAFPDLPLSRFIMIVIASALSPTLLVVGLFGSTFMGVVAGLIGCYAPFFVVSSKRARRQRLLTQQLPDAMDFLSRVMRAGHSLSTGLQMMGQELPEPLAQEFRRCYDQHGLGQALEDALRDMAGRVASTDFAFFVTAVLIQRQSGGDLAEVLRNISGMVRSRLRLQQSVRAKTAEGRFTGYIMVAFPAVMFCLAWMLNPDYGGVLLHTRTGLMLLGTAFGLQMMGLFFIKKITTVRI